MSSTDKNNINTFLDAIYKGFALLSIEDDVFYHSWKGNKKLVIQYFQGLSFPSIVTISKMTRLPDHLYVITSSNISKREIYGACILKINNSSELEPISFIIHPDFRKKGYGTTLLRQIDSLAGELRIKTLSLRYRSYWKSNDVWEKILANTGWSEPELLLHYFTLPDANTQFEKEWFKRAKLPEKCSVEEWSKKGRLQLVKVLHQPEWKGIVPRELNPFQMEKLILPHPSLLLKKDEEIVGWLICHLVQPDTVQATSLFVHPGKGKGLGLLLIAEAIRKRKLGLRIVFMVQKANEIMLNLIGKYFEDDRLETSAQFKRVKRLNI